MTVVVRAFVQTNDLKAAASLSAAMAVAPPGRASAAAQPDAEPVGRNDPWRQVPTSSPALPEPVRRP
ncbi:hypothetical protein [Streptomyces atratus]|uniref:Uncharacterized protein n=1 Tax=Streptomyces atratus TaxID=1893 RepID=A0A2Z5JNY9_STRAR|nr:hypothetical protein [Streptomyces atratus]AXE82156.1 hypothetical protein C5746_40725 [Streptomyces atratus]